MNGKPFTLPDEFGIGSKDALIRSYTTNRSSTNNKVVFTTNMCCLLLHGTKEVQTAAGKQTITDKDVLILTSGSILMTERVAENGRYEAVLVFFSNKLLADFCSPDAAVLANQALQSPVLSIPRDAFLTHYCASLQLLHAQQKTGMDEVKTRELLQYLSTEHQEAFRALAAQAFSRPADIKLKQVIELNAGKNLSVEELAFLCNMSMSTFKRHFAGLYGMPPQKYFAQLKMKQARQLLSAKQRPSDIYAALGYEHLSAFSTEFKKYYGLSPTQFQQQHGQKDEVFERSA